MLVIAGTDSSGGAGLTRDVQTISELGATASCAVTALTAQTHTSVDATCVLASELVREQLIAALRSDSVGAIKIGMLGNAAIVRVLLDELPDRKNIPIVLDPVLAASSGAALLDREGLLLVRDRLLARTTLVTPNLTEAAILLGQDCATTAVAQSKQAEQLLRFGSEYVLLKGGHGTGNDALDVLVRQAAAPTLLRAERLNASVRGTGCALGSAIAALLASGLPMESACRKAKEHVYMKLLAAVAR